MYRRRDHHLTSMTAVGTYFIVLKMILLLFVSTISRTDRSEVTRAGTAIRQR